MVQPLLRKLGLIIWKNLLLRERQYVVSFFEVFFTVFAALIIYISYLPSNKDGGGSFDKYNMIKEPDLRWEDRWCNFKSSSKDPANFIAYTPPTAETDRIMKRVAFEICNEESAPPTALSIAYVAVSNEAKLETMYSTKWKDSDNFTGAVVFPDGSATFTRNPVTYTIRLKPSKLKSTNVLLPKQGDKDFTKVGPNEGNQVRYKDSGFLGLQWHLDKAIIRELTSQSQFSHKVFIKPFPYPSIKDSQRHAQEYAFNWIYVILAWSTCFLMPAVTRNVAGEKRSGIAELLRLTGVPGWIQWVGWFIHLLVPQIISIFFLMLIICAFPFTGNRNPIIQSGDPSFLAIILVLHAMASIGMGLLLCALCQKPIIATSLGTLLALASMIAGSLFVVFPGMYGSYGLRLFLSFFPNFVLAEIWVQVVRWGYIVIDESDTPSGARWSIMTTPIASHDKNNVLFLILFLILLFEAVFYTLLGLYLDGVLPSEHGVRRPWYFFDCQRGRKQVSEVPATENATEVKPSIEGPAQEPEVSGTAVADNVSVAPKSTQDQEEAYVSSFEAEPVGAQVGVEIQNIYKRFGPCKTAVKGVSLKMYTGDIFALLGHNGAGKTTLISMLTGFFSPTAGTAVINGYDIRTSLDKARESMGLCPQQSDMLFHNLTCGEQLRLFGMIRGLTKQQAINEMRILLTKMKIAEKENVLASKLSGGQKRKLSLAIALIGGTKVLVLDEPTSSMDPQARREIWDLLLQLRGERTILLTTHFMEEADVLGDRIGIMANGQLQCCGSSSFLKKYYGTGLTLKLTLHGGDPLTASPSQQTTMEVLPDNKSFKPGQASEDILAVVQKHVPNARFKTDARVDRVNNEVFLCLPKDTATTDSLYQMFVDLTASKDKLGIKTIGLSQTTMDEVFVKVDELGHPVEHDTEMEQETMEKSPKAVKCIFVGQFLSLWKKMLMYSLRKWVQLFFQFLIPFLFLWLAIYLANDFSRPWTDEEAIKRNNSNDHQRSASGSTSTISHQPLILNAESLEAYYEKEKPITTFYSGSENLHDVIGPTAKIASDISVELLRVGEANRKVYKRQHIVAAEIVNSTAVQALFNLYPYHAAPVALNILSNFLLKTANKDVRIKPINHPFSGSSEESDTKSRSYQQVRSANSLPDQEFESKKETHNLWVEIPFAMSSTFSIGLILLVANFVVQHIEEKLCKVKQLQTMTGVSPLVYWGAAFTYDLFLYSLEVLVMLAYLVLADMVIGYKIFIPNLGWLAFLLICLAYGLGGIPFCYLVSLRVSSITGGFTIVFLVQTFIGLSLGATLPDKSCKGLFMDGMIYVGHIIGRCFPSYSLVRGIFYYAYVSASYGNCILTAVNPKICKPSPYLVWSAVLKGTVCEKGNSPRGGYGEPEYYTAPGILREVFFMILPGFFYMILLMVAEYKILRMPKRTLGDLKSLFRCNVQDVDVWMEAARVNALIANQQMNLECLLVKELCKNYGNFAAVSNLHFGVHHGECFGLLGVNGAGKTTAFRMITGDEIPAKGNAYGFGTSLESNSNKFIASISYCPQVDAILEHCTGKEMLQLFAGLRGVPFKLRDKEALRWLRRMGLSESANVNCGRYSGGMKRRLSTAMAMIGDPALILLDEPTCGLDPVSRRQFWSIMDKLRASGQSIILTSHSMEECEALCSRLGIMVNGQFQCFGGVQHLKSKFAQGYSLTIKLKQGLDAESDTEVNVISARIRQKFEFCELKDKHQNLMVFHLQNPSITWDVLFKSLEEVKAEFDSLIEDYSVNETSLEDVFLAFARVQHPERKARVSLCKQIRTCSC